MLGCVGKVVKVYSDGDMRVCINGHTWTFNPMCCIPRPQDQMQIDNTKSSEDNPGCSKSTTGTIASNKPSTSEGGNSGKFTDKRVMSPLYLRSISKTFLAERFVLSFNLCSPYKLLTKCYSMLLSVDQVINISKHEP